VNTYPDFDDNNELRQVVVTFMDITERKRVEEIIHVNQVELQRLFAETEHSRQALLSVVEDQKETQEQIKLLNAELEQRVRDRTAQLESSNKELEAFSYSVSHDLRAPLRGIDGWSLALSEDYQDHLDDKAQNYISRIRSEADKMGHLIDDLLRLSKITRMDMEISKVDLSGNAQKITDRLNEANQKQVKVVIQSGLNVIGDPNLIVIMLENLFSNAFKFSSKIELPLIEFGSTIIDGQMTYFIRDNGAGFEMEYAKNLFGAFQRMHKQADFPGTGVGLAIVQRIINRHGGKIWAEAKVNAGATFYFTLMEDR
jgi:light-regulated signal transduction histidine kinase (bacteriophytochrome)